MPSHLTKTTPDVDIRPVTGKNGDDFATLFEGRGGPHYCWCSIHRFPKGYPFDSAGISSTHRSHSSMFKDAGFRRDARRWFLNLDPA